MAERHDVAAWRHLRVGELLVGLGEFDDAGYHFGVSGENSIKFALWASGVRSAWIVTGAALGRSLAASLGGTPCRGHFPTLHQLVHDARADIAANAVGRYAAPIAAALLSSTFPSRFAGWNIDIRYADPAYTPVAEALCTAWRNDAEDLLLMLMI